jgi:hypothetical protein
MKMNNSSFSIRNFTEGDEKIQASIFNQVMKEIEPDIAQLTSNDLKGIYAKTPIFKPEHVRFLMNSNGEVIGYGECRGHIGIKYLDYPLVLREYRSINTLNMLFEANYIFVKENFPEYRIASHSYLEKFTQVHDFFQTQKIAQIKESHKAIRFSIPVDDLNIENPGYNVEPFIENDIEKLVKFRYSNDNIVGEGVTEKSLSKGFNSGKYSPEKSFLIYQNENIIAWTSTTIHTPINEAYSRRAMKFPIGVPNGYIIKYDHEDRLGLEKAMCKSAFEFLRKNGVSEYQIWIMSTSSLIDICEKIGFKHTGEEERGYTFE